MQEYLDELYQRKEAILQMGGKDKIDRAHIAGKYTARERIERLLDADSFMEIGMFSHSDMPGMAEKSPGDGVICGLGKVAGRHVVVEAGDKTVFAGTEGNVHIRKLHKLHDYAVKRGLPIFHLGDGGGLRMPDGMGSDGISDKMMPMTLLRHHREVPLLSAILGDSFGGPTWTSVASDFVAQVKGTCMAVAGPRMLEIATGERLTPEELGGWKIHAEQTGQVDVFSENEDECLHAMKTFFSFMPSHANEEPPFLETTDDPYRRLENVGDLVPTRRTRAYDMKKLIRSIVDDGIFFELKPYFGAALITGMAHMNGRSVGIIANQPLVKAGSAGPEECDKAIEFICLCDSYHIPLIFLHDIPGFRVGSAAEQRKIATKIMVWNQAIAYSTVPKISVVIRKSIGAAYSNMCGPMMGADFVVAWPTAEISFTGAEVGINVVYGRQLMEAAHPAEERLKLLEQWENNTGPYPAAGKSLIDDVIDPKDTRKFLAQSLDYACRQNGSKGQRLLANWPLGY